MKQPSRRRFLTGSAATVAGIAGISGGSNAKQFDSSDVDLSDDADDVFALVPSGSAVDAGYQAIVLIDVDGDDDATAGHEVRSILDSVDEVSVDDISQVVSAYLTDAGGQLGVAVGSFDRPEPGRITEERSDWRLAEETGRTYATADDRLVVAQRDESGDLVDAAVAADAGEADTFLGSNADAKTAFELLADQSRVHFVANANQAGVPGVAAEAIDAFAAGFETVPTQIDGTAENEYVLFPADDADLDDDAVEQIVTELEPGTVVTLDAEREDDFIYATVVTEEPPERDRDAAPIARFDTEIDHEDGTVVFRHGEGEPVDTADLELWRDGDLADEQPADDHDVLEAGDELIVDTDPVATFTLRWFDEDENVYYPYTSILVGRESFEIEYDAESERIRIEYGGERPADPEKLTVRYRSEDEIRSRDDFASEYDTITAGDSITIEGVSVGDRISLELDVPNRPQRARRQLAHYRVRPPRLHLHRRPRDGVIAYYRGDQERDAGDFRLLVDGEEGDTQFDDVADTLEDGDTVPLGEYDLGTTLTAEWTAPEEPVNVGELIVTPQVRTEMEYDDADGVLTIAHRDGDAVDVDDLVVVIDGEPVDGAVDGDSERYGPGDSLEADVDPFATVELRWKHAESDHETSLGRTVTAAETFEASYDGSTLELTYVGKQDVDPDRLGVHRRSSGGPGRDDPEPLFAAEYDTLTTGDGIELEDVEIDEWISVVLRDDDGGYRHPLFQFTPNPRSAFRFRSDDGDVVAAYTDEVSRDPGAFRILADGSETDVQPGDEYDELTAGDEIVLGSFDSGTELVVEWTDPDDPVTLRDHIVTPEAEFDVEFDDESEEVTVRHAGGNELDAEDVHLYVEPGGGTLIEWDDDGTVEAGDSRSLTVEEEPHVVLVVFRERDVIYEGRLDG